MTVRESLRRLDAESWAEQLHEYERLERLAAGEEWTEYDEYRRDDAGHPLGPGVPMGTTLRADGESHRDAWMRILRGDPCAFCGEAGGTVDHIEPQSLGARGRHDWTNYTGACPACNTAKACESMLFFLARRKGTFVPKVWPTGWMPKRRAA